MLVIFITVMGAYGVFRGGQALTDLHFERGIAADEARLADVAFLEAFHDDPNRRPLAAANILVSLMLLGGTALLSLRHRHAVWWLRQALVANVIWIGLHLASTLHHSYRIAPELLALLEAGTGGLITSGESRFEWLIVTLVVFAALNVGAHLFVAWRIGGADVRQYLKPANTE